MLCILARQEAVRSGQTECPECGTALPGRLCINHDVQRLVAKLHDVQRRARPRRTGTTASASTTQFSSAEGQLQNQGTAGFSTFIPNGSGAAEGDEDEGGGDGGAVVVSSSAPRHARAGEERNRPKFEVSCLLGRDTDQVRSVLATRFAALHASAMSRQSLLTHDLPRSCTKRVMRQDSADIRTVSSDAVALMEFATELFVGLVTALAWQVATQPAKRHTLGLSDICAAVACTSVLDFLFDIVVEFGAELHVGEFNPKQSSRLEARRQEKKLALGRLVGTLVKHGSRSTHAKRRQRGLGGRFLGSAESNAIECLVGGPPQPAAKPAAPAPPTPPVAPPMPPPQPQNGTPAPGPVLTIISVPTQPMPSRDQRRSIFGVANVMRVMSHNLPGGVRARTPPASHPAATRLHQPALPFWGQVKISRDAKECMCQIATEMCAFVTMEACNLAKASKVSKAAVGLDECVTSFTRLGLEGFLPTIQHWVQATHAARMASRRRHRAQLLKQAQAAQGLVGASAAASELQENDGEDDEDVDMDDDVDGEEGEGEE